MQSARGKADVLSRKAKVCRARALALCIATRTDVRDSSPTRTRNSSSKRVVVTLCYAPADNRSEFSNKDLKSVGNYTLGRLIGKGSFGKVYLAHHKLINNSKVCRSVLAPTAQPLTPNRSFSSLQTKATPILLEKSTTTDSLYIPISLDCTR